MTTVVSRQALSRFDVGFRLVHQGRVTRQLTPALSENTQIARVSQLLGSGFMDAALPVDASATGLSLKDGSVEQHLIEHRLTLSMFLSMADLSVIGWFLTH